METSHSLLRNVHFREKVEEFVRIAGAAGLTALNEAAASAVAARHPVPGRSEESSGDQLGAWRVERQDGRTVLRRNATRAQHRHWADLEEVSLFDSEFKVALLGESVARGYLLDPAYTPANALQDSLNAGGSKNADAVKVVDLAKTDLTLAELEAIVARLPLIQPDAVVLFIGNNVARLPLDASEKSELAEALRQGGMPALQRRWRDEFAPARIRQTLRQLAVSVSDPASVVVVVPEFNLLGWLESEIAGLPWRPEEDIRAWFTSRELLDHTTRSSERGADRLQALRRMQEADQGLGWRAHWEQGWTAHAEGRADEARRHFENARDCKACLFVPHTPRCTASMQSALHSEATELGFAVVDLREVLSPTSNGGLPDRRYFLDYCHLSAEGVGEAAQAINRAIRPRHSGKFDLSDSGRSGVPPPCPLVVAASLLLAAVHNAHYGQPCDVVVDYVDRAFTADPRIAEAAEQIVSLLIDVGPTWSNRSFPAICAHPMLRRYFPGDDRAVGGKFEDTALTEALVEKLCEAHPEKRQGYEERLQATMLVDGIQDLTDPIAHARSFRALHNYTYYERSAYLKAFDRKMRFRFVVSNPGRKVRLCLCFRAAAAIDQPLEISVNDCWSMSASCPCVWTCLDLVIEEHALLRGINRVTLTWPMAASASVRPERLRERLACGEDVDALAWFGEIFSFTVQAIPDEHADLG